MNLIPKRTKYRFKFRNKTASKKTLTYDLRQKAGNQIKSKQAWPESYGFNVVHAQPNLSAWLPYYGVKSDARAPLNSGIDLSRELLFGNYGFAFESHGTLSAKFVETVRLDIARALKKKAKVWLRLCCDTPVTARPVETRMGKGKGSISGWQAKVRPGQVFIEFSGLTKSGARDLLQALLKKAPLNLVLKG